MNEDCQQDRGREEGSQVMSEIPSEDEINELLDDYYSRVHYRANPHDMVKPMPELFPFGDRVLPRPPSNDGRGSVFVLGAYPSGLHVSWKPPVNPVPGLRPVRAMIVANEPTPFWDGSNAVEHFDTWKHTVDWQTEWGEIDLAPAGLNGPSGAWVSEHILRPLGVTHGETCLSDCLDQARLNAGQAARVQDTYEPFASTVGLPPCTLRPVPAGENGIVAEARSNHLPRLLAELRSCEPEVVVTLGNAALRVAKAIFDSVEPDPGNGLTSSAYGIPLKATYGGNAVTWIPLVHPRSGERTHPWPDVHAAWEGT